MAVFFATLVVLSLAFWALAWLEAAGAWAPGSREARQWFVTGLMWCPGLAALAAVAGNADRALLGLALPRFRWLGVGLAWPLCYIGAAYALVWAAGFGQFDAAPLVEQAQKRHGLDGTAALAVGLLAPATFGVLAEIGRSLGEELGWRGFLAPAWTERWGLEVGGLLSGLVWALWHLPLLLAYGFGDVPTAFAVACFVVDVAALGYACAWLRWRSGSVWPAVLLHAMHNAVLYAVFDLVTTPVDGRTAWAAGEGGFALAAANVAAAAALWACRRRGLLR